MRRAFAIFAAAASLLSALPAHAAGPGVSLKGDVKLERTLTENGRSKVELVDPKVVVPGDRLRFATRYRNDGPAPAERFVITNALPSAVMLASDAPPALEVSVDGGKAWGRLAALTVPDGKGGKRPATSSDVTHVRWVLATIAPGASGTVEYGAIVR